MGRCPCPEGRISSSRRTEPNNCVFLCATAVDVNSCCLYQISRLRAGLVISAKSASSTQAGVQVEDGEQRQGHQRRRVRVKSAADVHFPQLAREVEIGTF